MKFSENEYVDASQQKKIQQKIKNEEKFQNQNLSKEFSEIQYVNASQQKKIHKKNVFRSSPFLVIFGQKTAKNVKKLKKIANSKPFDELF